MERRIRELEGSLRGYDIYIIGSGPTAGFISPEFFNNKYVIGLNEVWVRFPNVDYLLRKESARSEAAYSTGIPLVVSRHSCGTLSYERNKFDGPRDYYVFTHSDNRLSGDPDLSAISRTPDDPDRLVVGYSTLVSGIHFAAFLGASSIILVGCDAGTLNGETNFPGYPPSIGGDRFYRNFLNDIEGQTKMVTDKILEVYGVPTYSLNPFLSFRLDGNKFE